MCVKGTSIRCDTGWSNRRSLVQEYRRLKWSIDLRREALYSKEPRHPRVLAGCIIHARLDQGIEVSCESMVKVGGPVHHYSASHPSEFGEEGVLVALTGLILVDQAA